MFERYTERARRVVFFSRYEASQFGSLTIESEHLLLGLLREAGNVVTRFFPDGSSPESIRAEIEKAMLVREKIPTSVDLPISNEGKRILAYSAEEAERLNHRHIDLEHLLLGMLREQSCGAAQVLHGHGLRVESIRDELARQGLARHPMPQFGETPYNPPLLSSLPNPALLKPVVPNAETAMRIAEAIWIPLCGEEMVKRQMPLNAELKHNVWIVTGSAAAGETQSALFAFILQTDGRILSLGGVT